MAKQKKKRSKKYTGADAKTSQPQIVRIQAVKRSKFGQWWFEKKKFRKPVLIASAIVLVLVFLIVELVRLII